MSKIVVDSSVIVKWLNKDGEENTAQADKLLIDVEKGRVELLASELAKYEVGNALIRKGLNVPQTMASLATLYSLPIEFFPETEKLSRLSVKFSKKYSVTYYDAAPAVIAKTEKAVLITDNIKHQGKIKTVKAVPLNDY